ncbi:uncharacterized protein MONBRDRAFT_20505 [Monosiga brevicollis MX1]|uniref:Uncharacterized protein n=1 Tax=Monosiga brevicollis TaxID=81824 RepID=A9UW58_MONBE|nr:uncharacterized protein MONBRDRAFT_20505 [Monosiga brevicollis MX1]EDQ90710.1 predicted protein [Monosiga brevicollis MX1]|eukprot:XP_001744761.1 hypothetical protein [Monosiga brevicollis MX1]
MKLDASGRVIDESGKVVQLEQRQSDFAGNARAKRQEKLSQVTKEVQDEEADRTNSEFYDARLVEAAKEDRGQRKRRALRFHEPGKFQEYADRLRAKAKLEQLQSEVSSAAQKAGISAAARLALVPKREELESTTVPDVEWWDQVLLGDQTYEAQAESGKPLNDITRLVQHPVTFDQYSAQRNVTLPAYLTKKEQKKIRKQRRRAEEEEKQTLIGLGKMEAPAPKVKISNLMRVLGTEAVQDPTKVEAVVRAQMQMRQRQHEEHNAKTKLSDEQRRAKKAKKLQDSTADGVAASLFLVSSMKSEKNKFKVETNAKQYNMTGAAIMTPTNNIVIVEGGPRNMRKYKRLMTHRINWNDKVANSAADDEDGEGEERGPNTCTLIWEGTLERRFFKDFFIKFFRSEALAREWLDNRRSAHYWDLALTSDLAQSEKQ